MDRKLYPESDYPFGQWEYQRFYEEHFDRAVATFDADPYRTIKALFRRGTPKPPDRPNMTALVRKDGGWIGGAPVARLGNDGIDEILGAEVEREPRRAVHARRLDDDEEPEVAPRRSGRTRTKVVTYADEENDVPARRTARKRRAAANDRSPFKSANVFGF